MEKHAERFIKHDFADSKWHKVKILTDFWKNGETRGAIY